CHSFVAPSPPAPAARVIRPASAWAMAIWSLVIFRLRLLILSVKYLAARPLGHQAASPSAPVAICVATVLALAVDGVGEVLAGEPAPLAGFLGVVRRAITHDHDLNAESGFGGGS